MNKIFKVIFSKAKGCYVVVSELAKSAGKGTSASHIQRGYKLTLAAAVLSMMMGMAPVGAVDLGYEAAAVYDDKGNLIIGDPKTVAEGDNRNGENNTTIGTQTDTLRNVTEGETKKNGQPMDTDANSQLVEGEGKAHDLTKSTEAGGSTAVGYQSRAEGDNSTAIGNNAKITNKPVTYYVDADGKKTASPENAVWYKDSSGNPTKVPQVFRDADGNTTITPQYVHTYTEKDPDTKEDVTKTEITSDAAKADKDSAGNPVYNYKKEDNTDKLYSVTLYQAASNSIAAGTSVTANGSNAVAVGYGSTADNSAVAIGDTAKAKENAVAIGKDTKAMAEGSIALGKGSEADRDGGVSGWDPKIGKTSTKTDAAWQSGEGALSIGNGGASRQITNVAAGSEDSDAVNLAQLKNAMTHYYSVNTTAETDGKGENNYLNDGATGDNALAAGVSAKASGDNATAVGYNTSAAGTGATAIGNGSKVTVGTDGTGGGVAVGNGATASGNGASFGTTGVSASSGGLAVGMYGTNASSNSAAFGLNSTTATNSSVAVGTDGTTADNSSFAAGFTSKAGANGSSSYYGHNIAVGSNTAADNGSSAFGINATANYQSLAIGLHGNSSSAYATNQSIAVGNGTNAFNFSTAIGNQAQAGNNGSYAVALGNEASALYDQTTAIGSGAKVISPYGTALGSGTSAAYYATALGNSASANYSYATAIGSSAQATDTNATAVGNGAKANKSGATALGYSASATHDYSTAVGDGAGAHGTSATALGNGASANSAYDTAIGSGAATGGGNGTALGSDAKAQSPYATALGSSAEAYFHAVAIGDATASSSYALAAGDGATAQSDYAIALGSSASSNVEGGVALGSNSTANVESGKTGLDPHTGAASTNTGTTWVSTLGAVSVGTVDSDGNATGTRQINGLAAGTNDTDAVNVAQLKAMETRINMHYYSVNSTLSGDGSNYDNTGASGTNALASGPMASATVENAVAIGYGAKAEGKGATVIGQYGKATGRYALAFGGQQTDTTAEQADNVASGDNALSFGERTTASGTNSTAFGWQTTAKEKRATAFGERTTASGANATAFGQLATASGQNSVAFGNEAVANNYGSTAFGNRTEALGEYSTAFGNSTVAAGMNTAAFGTDNVAGAVLDENGAYTNIIYQTNPKNGRVVKDPKGNPIEISREKMDARGNLAYLDGSGHTKSVTYTVPGGETHSYVLLQGTDGNTYIRDYRGNIRSATIGTDGTVTVGDTASADVTLKQATAGANGYHILSNANATVWGKNSIASGEASTAFGVGSIAAAQNSLAALGGTVAASATNAAAIGSGAKATLEDSVALGSGAVADRKSGAKGYDMLTKGDTTNTTAAWVSSANAIAVGNGSTLTRQITGVAAGSQDTDAVNVAQLKAAGFKVTTQNDGSISSSILNGDTLDFEAKDNAIVSTSKDSKTITVAVSKTPTFDSATFGTTNNEKVTIANGQVSAYNDQQQKRAVVGVDNQGNGTLFLVNDDLSQAHLYTQSSKETGNDGITRMYYTSSTDDNGGEVNGVHTIAVLDDGINYAGDNVKPNTSEKVVVKHKLNSTMDITGGADTNNLAEGNIGVVATPAAEDKQGNITQKAKLELKLNKDLTGLNTVTAGAAKIGSAPADTLKLTENGAVTEKTAPAGSYVTGLDNKDWNTTNPSYVSGRAATEDQLAAVSGTINQGLSFTTNTKDVTNTTDNYKGYKVVNRKLGDTIAIKASDETANHSYSTKNLTTRIAENGDIFILMDENPAFTSVTTSDVIFAGNPDLTDKDGKPAQADTNVHYGAKTLTDSQNITTSGNDPAATRLHYKDEQGHTYELATMDDGQIYAGDIKTDGTPDTTGFGRKMNEKTTINGGVTDKGKLTDKNIGVISNGTDTLTVKLAKDLKDLNSVTTGKTVMDDSGIKITNDAADETKNVVINGDKISYGGNQVTDMGSGADGTADGKPTYNTDTNGANIGDVKNIAGSTVQPVIDTVNKGWELDVNGTKQKAVTPVSPKVNLIQGQNITIVGDTANTDNVTISTADDVRFNTVRVGGTKTGDTYSGGIVIGSQSGKNADGSESANSNDGNYITGLENTNWDSKKIQHGRAATEDQLLDVATKIQQGSVAGDIYVTGGAVSYHGEGTDTQKKDGKGSIKLTRQNAIDVTIDGLHDYYVTGGTVSNDGKTLELTRNDTDGSGNPQKITVDLGNVAKNDLHLVANPETGSEGKYTVDSTTGTVTLKVQNGDGTTTNDITIGGFEGLGKGFNFGANQTVAEGGKNPVTNQLGSTISIKGDGNKALDKYSGKNLITTVEQDASGNTTIHVLMDRNISADGVTVGQAGKDGADGLAGTIGINGKDGMAGADGKQGITTTIIRTEKGQTGADGKNGKPGVDGTDITRIVYQNSQDSQDGTDGKDTHTVATLDDGLKFAGDDGQNDDTKVITKKLNERLDIVGKAQGDLTDANIGVTKDNDGQLYVRLAKHVNLDDDGTLKAGAATIGAFSNTELTTNKGNHPVGGSYATGLSNREWNVTDPEYVKGRAATEDQLAEVSKAIGNATTAAGKRTVVTVNDKSNPAEATPNATVGAYGDYDSTGGNLMIAAKKDSDGVLTYNIKLNDQLAIGQTGEPGVAGKDGKDGKVTVETKGGTTVVIGHDGKDGDNGRDGLFVTGKDGADGVSITGPDGAAGTDGIDGKVGIAGKDGNDAVSISGKDGVGHIGLTGPKGTDGKNADIDISTALGTATLDPTKNEQSKAQDKVDPADKAARIQYESTVTAEDGTTKTITHEVATMDDGLKFVGNDGKEVAKKLNSTLSLTGGIKDATDLQNASGKNLGVRSNEKGDGLEIVMTDTPDFTKVTVGEGNDTTGKITIGKQTVTGKKSDGSDGAAQTGNYITGLDNKAWDKDNVVENRAATEGQLRDIAGSITNQTQGGGFALTSDEKGDDKIVKQDLGKAIQIKGDTTYKTDGSVEKAGNIKTSIDNGAIKVGLNKDVDLGNDGSVKAGNTTIDKDGVETNKVKVGEVIITKDGINGGSKQITNIASGIDGKQYADAGDNNAASIGDVKQLAQQEAQASEARSGKNITVKDDHTVNLNDHITLGDDKDKTKQVSIDGKGAKITAGDGVNTVTMDGTNGQVTIGSGDKTLTLGQQANGAGDKNPATGNFLNGLDNRNWDGEHIQNGRAATEDQLKTVSDKVKSGRVFQGDDGQKVTVGLGDTLKIQGGAKDVSSDNNIGIVKGANDTLNVRLAKDLTGLNSVTTGNTTINNGGLTIKTGDGNRTITVQDGNVNMGGNQIHHVAPGQAPDDAVNVSQLNATNYAVNKLDTRVNRVGANAAALAALHPLDFDPDDKWDFSAGYGHYKDANAAAVGAFYRPNEDTMFSVGGSFGGGENMVNAGVSVKLGQGNHVSTSRVAMAKEIKDLKKDVAALKAVVNQQSALIDKLTGVNAGELSGSDDLFPDVPANHWAYEYVTRLKQAGILTGYPDGNFAGDRMMTRYEFAAIVYRAIMAGAAANPSLNKDGTLDRLAKEFSSEMKYIRIDTIRKDRNGRPTIQRVRVIKEDEKEK